MEERMDVSAGERVELVYVPTRDEMAQAFRARAGAVPSMRWLRRLSPVAFAIGGTAVAMGLLDSGRLDWFTGALLGWMVWLAFSVYGHPVLLGHQWQKLIARQGLQRVTIDASGLTAAHDTASGHNTWGATPRYAETRDVFVLLSGDKKAACVIALPKRGIQPAADVDALRSLLDRHISRA
ncbi:hypothetical protein ACIBI4_26450 [Streptomyces sp. NPDC050418]|uniref:hypothetical protein n=1 Tax=Streptomyces sp. NPDC050418 TaxID=3365612 RepID=UPI0037B2B00F